MPDLRMESDAPLLKSVAFVKLPTGYVVVRLQTQGNRVVAKETLSDIPEPKDLARLRYQVEALRLLLPLT